VENVIDFSETLVRSVMTPRIDMTAVPVAASLPETLQTVIASGHSRLPVFEKTSDTIVGIVHAKDLLPLFADGTAPDSFALRAVMRPPVFVPESRRVADLLAEMRRSKNQIAVVQDEYGGTAGIVSLEDLLEEIVGDIRDEYDVDEPEMKVLDARESVIDGRMNIADVNDRLGLELSDEEYTTIGGLVFGLLGHEPKEGEHVHRDGVTFVVDQMEKGRVKIVRAVRQERGGDLERSPEAVGAGQE
jgi:CBS domain containing-hemolysin-like protein